ncbi:MAG: hypothetical protein C6H99_06325 [Epsilonproteobacteria bacterium]|nr:hypothetical protein [Campylobacterota bacterium]NPA63780.1 hypothetical protein [Campylobacterota bacterium]
MRIFFSLLPLNIIPIALIFLHEFGYIEYKDNYTFALIVSGLLIFTLSIEMVKSAMFALSGPASWLDFFMSFLLLIAVFGYIVYVYVKQGGVPSPLFWLALEAQTLDVVVGFYIAVTNARRDIGVEH